MSEIKHSFRIMIIDIEKDKVVLDEFADAIVGGIAKNGSSPKNIDRSEMCICKSSFAAGIGAVADAEAAIHTQKKQVIKSFMEKATPEMIKECFGGEESEDDTAE
jgi:hypothetical protein